MFDQEPGNKEDIMQGISGKQHLRLFHHHYGGRYVGRWYQTEKHKAIRKLRVVSDKYIDENLPQ